MIFTQGSSCLSTSSSFFFKKIQRLGQLLYLVKSFGNEIFWSFSIFLMSTELNEKINII